MQVIRATVADAPTETEQEQDLIRRIIAGARDEFSLLIEQHQSTVFSVIMRQIGDRATSEEIAQETFLRAYRGLKGFRFNSRFRTWLIRIALLQTSTYFSSRRYKQLRRSKSFDPVTHDSPSGEGNPDSDLDRSRSIKQFQQALGSLSPKLRDVLVLCGLEQMAYEDASDLLAIPVGTVRSRLNRTRIELKQALRALQGEKQ